MTLFNRTPPVVTDRTIKEPPQSTIEATFNLRQVSFDDAWKYGGPITRAALEAMNLRRDHKYIVVDTKVCYLMPGMYPSIPGWHTDGVPRGTDLNPGGKGPPNLEAQEAGLITAPRYHLLVTGEISRTEFLTEPMELKLPSTPNLYREMTKQVDERLKDFQVQLPSWPVLNVPSCTVVEWDWWNIHRAEPAIKSGFRYLIRATETDHIAPRSDPKDFIRLQTQVYVPTDFGW